MADDNILSTDLKYAQHNPFFISLQKDIDQIKELNKLLREDTSLIEQFFSLINTLYNAHIVYSPLIQDKLNKIEGKIYSPTYQKHLKANSLSAQMLGFQYKVIKELEHCFQILIKNFESNGLLPKRITTQTNKIGAVRMMR